MENDKPKVAAVETKDHDGLLTDTEATVTTDEGESVTAKGVGKADAIEKAAAKARE